jgi:hypothetical protein
MIAIDFTIMNVQNEVLFHAILDKFRLNFCPFWQRFFLTSKSYKCPDNYREAQIAQKYKKMLYFYAEII